MVESVYRVCLRHRVRFLEFRFFFQIHHWIRLWLNLNGFNTGSRHDFIDAFVACCFHKLLFVGKKAHGWWFILTVFWFYSYELLLRWIIIHFSFIQKLWLILSGTLRRLKFFNDISTLSKKCFFFRFIKGFHQSWGLEDIKYVLAMESLNSILFRNLSSWFRFNTWSYTNNLSNLLWRFGCSHFKIISINISNFL